LFPSQPVCQNQHRGWAEQWRKGMMDPQPWKDCAMTFYSILFENESDRVEEVQDPPVYFPDLNLDQVVNAITHGRQEYQLKPFFYTPLQSMQTISYRQEIARDLENPPLLEMIRSFGRKMSTMRRYLGMLANLQYPYHIKGWILEAALQYCNAITSLAEDLHNVQLASRGMQLLRQFLEEYTRSPDFLTLQTDALDIKEKLQSIQYSIIIRGNSVRVQKYNGEMDYSEDVGRTFEKFQQGEVKDYTVALAVGSGMNHVEAQILDFVVKLFPEVFSQLDEFYERHRHFLNPTIRVFDREIQFYVAYLDYINFIQWKGLKFCFPEITQADKEIYSRDGFDIALAYQRRTEGETVVTNDFSLGGAERILIISGPNQGGKTTFARAFGQIHYLASLGCPVPGKQARLFLFDQIFTHFETEEDIRNLRGKLQDDLVRIHTILDQASPNSIVIMNEIFNSTTLKDAVFLGRKIMEQIIQLDLLCVCVTFIEELAALGEKTVSMVSTVVPDNPTERTYKIVRKPADGLSYALCIAEKHRLTYSAIKERIQQ